MIREKHALFLILLTGFLSTLWAQPALSDITKLLTDSLDKSFNGKVCVMVMHGDSLVYYNGLGGYDSNSTGMVASVSKTFSGLLMLKLAGLGHFGLDDSIGKFIPYATTVGKGSGTIRQNFSHTGGWDGSAGEGFLTDKTLTLAQCVDSILTYDPQIYVPGKAFKYTGVAMQVAARCAEIAAGRSWNSLFNEYIKTPLQLTRTSYASVSPDNPRIAGGVLSCAADLLKLARLIQHNGRAGGTQVIDSAWMAELWKDQTFGARQIGSPYPYSPKYNNPYGADTIRYGIGTWLDIYNPGQEFQEQISGAGAFGAELWVNRCNNTAGALFTMSLYAKAEPTIFQMLDIVNSVYPNQCYQGSTPSESRVPLSHSRITGNSPNPFNPETRIGFSLATAGVYTLSFYDMTGRRVKTVTGNGKSGYNSVVWNAGNAPSGLYGCVLSNQEGRDIRLLTLLK